MLVQALVYCVNQGERLLGAIQLDGSNTNVGNLLESAGAVVGRQAGHP